MNKKDYSDITTNSLEVLPLVTGSWDFPSTLTIDKVVFKTVPGAESLKTLLSP